MSDSPETPDQRDFYCSSCKGRILIPLDLPPTTAPCPICGVEITSPPPPATADVEPVISIDNAVVEAPAAEGHEGSIEEHDETGNPSAEGKGTSYEQMSAKKGLVILVILGLIAAIAALLAYFFLQKPRESGMREDPAEASDSEEIRENIYNQFGWQKDAKTILQKFFSADSAESKAKWVIDPKSNLPQMRRFYQDQDPVEDSETPVEGFSIEKLSADDAKRGLFLLTYNQPSQFAISEFFRPIASLEVQYGFENAGLLLSAFGNANNFSMDPIKVSAFFKATDTGLKLDWNIFVQTRYRLLNRFLQNKEIGSKETFRVLINEDVPEEGLRKEGLRTYTIMDPAMLADRARIQVTSDSDLGKKLSEISWIGNSQLEPELRTATVELEWIISQGNPTLRLATLICWQFLGLGADKVEPTVSSD